MPYQLDPTAVARAFGGGQTVWNGKAVNFSTHEVAKLGITSGEIAASDPFIDPSPPPFTRSVPVGEHPVELALARFDDDERVAFARVRFGEAAPSRWEMAHSGANDPSTLGPDEFFGYAVDAGTGCFMDPAAGVALNRRMDAEPDYSMTLVDGLDAHQRDTWSWLDERPDPNSQTNVVCFSTGWGDGRYPTFFGVDGTDRVVQVVTDFLLLSDDVEHAQGTLAPFPASVPTKRPWWRFWTRAVEH